MDDTVLKYTDKNYLISFHESDKKESEIKPRINVSDVTAFYASLASRTTSISASGEAQVKQSGSCTDQKELKLDPINRVNIKTLTENIDKVLDGKFFLCRIIAPPFKVVSIITIVDDPEGQLAVRLTLCKYSISNVDLHSDSESLLEDLPVGTILVIKNPQLKTTSDPGGLTVRCDNPDDVVFISEKEFPFPDLKWEGEIPIKYEKLVKIIPRNADEWKNKGNKLFVTRRFRGAVEAYTEGYNLAVPTDNDNDNLKQVQHLVVDMLVNRAAAYLNLECFRKALEDCETLLKLDPGHIKGIYRKAKALCGLQRFGEAEIMLKENVYVQKTKGENKVMFTVLLCKIQALENQRITGGLSYDIIKMFKKGNVGHEYDDVADFTGPLKIEQVPGKGRGIVATDMIYAGQLIMVSRAFAIALPHPQSEDGLLGAILNLSYNLELNVIRTEAQIVLAQAVAEKLRLDPSLAKVVYSLYSGAGADAEDKFAGERELKSVDMKRINAICAHNAFVAKHHSFKSESKFKFEVDASQGSGLWILPSYINHSCWDCNCMWRTFGNILIIRTFKNIARGEEILISYINPCLLYPARSEYLERQLGFLCQCQLCKLDRDDSPMGLKRIEILKEIESSFSRWDVKALAESFENLDTLSFKLENGELNPSVVQVLVNLAEHYYVRERDEKKSLEVLIKCHDMVKDSPLMELASQICVNVIDILLMTKNKKEAKKWVKNLRRDVNIFCGNLEWVKVIGANTLKLMDSYGISL